MKQDFFSRRLGVSRPVLQASLGANVATPDFVATVSNSGGLGVISGESLSPQQLKQQIHLCRSKTEKPFAVHLTVPQPYEYTDDQVNIVRQCLMPFAADLGLTELPLDPPLRPKFSEQVAVVLEEAVPILRFSEGVPSLKWFDALKSAGIIVIGSACTVDEAKLLEKVGVDAIVAQGLEAGGSRSHFLEDAEFSLLARDALTALVSDSVDVPVIASGGLTTAEAMHAALEECAGLEVSSPFLLSSDSGLFPELKARVLALDHDSTLLSNAYTGRMARVLDNRFVQSMASYKPFLLPSPAQSALLKPFLQSAIKHERYDLLPVYAEQGIHLVQQQSIKAIMDVIQEPFVAEAI